MSPQPEQDQRQPVAETPKPLTREGATLGLAGDKASTEPTPAAVVPVTTTAESAAEIVRAQTQQQRVAGATPAASSRSSSRPVRSPEPAPAAPGLLDRAYTFGGIACIGAGASVALAAKFSPALVAPLAAIGNPYSLGTVTCLAGAVLFGIGRVRRSLVAVANSIARVREETACIDDVARDTEELGRSVVDVSATTVGLRGELVTIQRRLDELTKVASNPEVQTSIFHLAASQDQLAKRVDTSMQERFRVLSAEMAAMVASFGQAQRELAKQFDALNGQVDEQFNAHQARMRKSLEGLTTAATESRARLERALESVTEVAQEVAHLRAAAIESTNELSAAQQRAAQDAAAGLELAREQLTERLDMLMERAAELDTRVEATHDALTQRVKQFAGEHALALQAVTDGVGALAPRLEQRLKEEVQAVRNAFQANAHATSDAQRALSTGVTELRDAVGELRQDVDRTAGDHATAWGELGQRLDSERGRSDALVRDGLAELAATTQAAQRELVLNLERLAPELDERVREHADALRIELQTSSQTATEARRELSELRGDVETLAARLARDGERVESAQTAGFDEISTRLTAERAHGDAALERGLASLEQTLAARLARDVERVESAQTAGFEEISTRLTADRAHGDAALERGLASLEQTTREATRTLGAELEQSVARLDGAQAAGFGGLAEHLQATRSQISVELDRGLAALVEASQRAYHELEESVRAITPTLGHALEQAFDEHFSALRSTLERTARTAEDAASQLRAGFEEFGTRLEQGIGRIDGKQSAVLSEITGRLATDRMHGDLALREGLQTFETLTQNAQQALTADVSRLAPELRVQLREELEVLHSHLADASLAARESAERLRAGVEELGQRIEAGLRTRHDALAQDLLALAELAQETPTDARAAWNVSERPAPLPAGKRSAPATESMKTADGESNAIVEPPAPLPRGAHEQNNIAALFATDVHAEPEAHLDDVAAHSQHEPCAPTEIEPEHDHGSSDR